MTIETETKKVSDMTVEELNQMITNLASKPILMLAGALADIKESISLIDTKGHCS